MKAILVMEMLESCLKCPMLNGNDECILQGEDKNFEADTFEQLRDGCPLKPIPERKQNACSHGFAGGWNACIDAIEGSKG